MFQDVWTNSRHDVKEVLDSVALAYNRDHNTDGRGYNIDKYFVSDMSNLNLMIKTRPSYPSDKLTFTIANVTKEKQIRFLNINLILNGRFNVDLTLEDSKRRFS